MNINLLGTGPSHGVPVIGCNCSVCTSNEPKNKRDRASVLITYQNTNILIDTPPEFRLQMISNKVSQINGVLFTHQHADHIHGFDDLRRFNQIQKQPIPCYANKSTVQDLKKMYSYVFRGGDPDSSTPNVSLYEVKEKFQLNNIDIQPIPIYHGQTLILGYRIGNFAYLTDCSQIPQTSFQYLKGLELLVIGALRYRPHPNHLSVDEAVEMVNQINPQKALFTHMTHKLDYHQLNAQLPPNISPAYDGQIVKLHS